MDMLDPQAAFDLSTLCKDNKILYRFSTMPRIFPGLSTLHLNRYYFRWLLAPVRQFAACTRKNEGVNEALALLRCVAVPRNSTETAALHRVCRSAAM